MHVSAASHCARVCRTILSRQAIVGSLTAAIAPHLAVDTFGDSWLFVAVFLFFYVLVVLTLPMEAVSKKFSLARSVPQPSFPCPACAPRRNAPVCVPCRHGIVPPAQQ